MSNPWFRLYAEFAHDPKVQMLSELMQRRYIMLMCLRCSNVTVTLRDDELAFQLRISDDELALTKALFITKGFINEDWELLNWDKRQFTSDRDLSGAERQKRHRDKVRNALRNVTVTLPDTDTDTDTDKKKTAKPAAAQLFVLPEWIPQASWAGYVDMRKKQRKPMTDRARTLVINELLKNKQLGHDVGSMLDKSTSNCWTDVYAPKDLAPQTFAQIKADVARATVPSNGDAEATKLRLDADAAIPRSGPSLAVLAQMAALRGNRVAA